MNPLDAPISMPVPARERRLSVLVLTVLVGLIPLAGIQFFGWSVWTVLLLFWVENILLGAVTLLRILVSLPGSAPMWAAKLVLLPFFAFHYGFFCAGHLVFLAVLFSPGGTESVVGSPWDQLQQVPQMLSAQPGLPLLALLIGAGLLLRMLIEFVLSGAYRTALPQVEMFRPYSRIIVLHVTIIISAVLVMAIGQPMIAVYVLVALKLAVELGYWRVGEADPEDEDDPAPGVAPQAG